VLHVSPVTCKLRVGWGLRVQIPTAPLLGIRRNKEILCERPPSGLLNFAAMQTESAQSNAIQKGLPLILLLGTLTAFDPLSIDMYLPAFPDIGKEFAVSSSAVELSLTTFFIGLALGQLIYGPLSDRYGRRMPLLIGMSFYCLSSMGCAFSSGIHMLIVFRVLQALGGCSGMVVTRAIVRDLYDNQRSAHIYSILMLVMGIAPILAPLIGGYVAKYFGWRMIFVVLGTFSLITLACTFFFLPETHRPSAPVRAFGSTWRAHLELLQDKGFLGYTLMGAAIQSGMFAYIAASPFVFIVLFGVAPVHYGWIFGVNAAGIIAGSQINRALLKTYSFESILSVVVCFSGLFAIALFLASLLNRSLFLFLLPLFLYIATLGFVFPNSSAGALAHQGRRAGTASSLFGAVQWSCACISSLLVSLFHNGTALPMTGIILVCGILGFLVLQMSVRGSTAAATSG
jgi:MFS transporter, DHA1 family, multidrug resistance protein